MLLDMRLALLFVDSIKDGGYAMAPGADPITAPAETTCRAATRTVKAEHDERL
jgi:hypothetical protein